MMQKSGVIILFVLVIVLTVGGIGLHVFLKGDQPFVVDRSLLEVVPRGLGSWSGVLGSQARQMLSKSQRLLSSISQVDDLDGAFDREDENKGDVLLRIGLVSDSHGHTGNLERAVKMMEVEGVDLIIHLGDFTAGGEEEYFAEAYRIFSQSGLTYFVLPGDHDFNWVPNHSRVNFEKYFGQSYNQLHQVGSATIVLLENSVDLGNSVGKLQWLTEVLTNHDPDQLLLFFSSRPLQNPYFANKNDPQGEEIIDLLVAAGVRYAIAGDTHIFSKYEHPDKDIVLVTVGAVGEYKNPLPQWVLMTVFMNGNVEFAPQPLTGF